MQPGNDTLVKVFKSKLSIRRPQKHTSCVKSDICVKDICVKGAITFFATNIDIIKFSGKIDSVDGESAVMEPSQRKV